VLVTTFAGNVAVALLAVVAAGRFAGIGGFERRQLVPGACEFARRYPYVRLWLAAAQGCSAMRRPAALASTAGAK
jgi:hypothetical protein